MALACCAGSSRRLTQVFGSFSSSHATSAPAAATAAVAVSGAATPTPTRRVVAQTVETADSNA